MGVDHGENDEEEKSKAREPVGTNRRARTLPDLNIYRPPALRKIQTQEEGNVVKESSCTTSAEKQSCRRSKPRRPDIQVYVPRAKRTLSGDKLTLGSSAIPTAASDTRDVVTHPSRSKAVDTDERKDLSEGSAPFPKIPNLSQNTSKFKQSTTSAVEHNKHGRSITCESSIDCDRNISQNSKCDVKIKKYDDDNSAAFGELVLEKSYINQFKNSNVESNTDDSDIEGSFDGEMNEISYPYPYTTGNDSILSKENNKGLTPFAKWMETCNKSNRPVSTESGIDNVDQENNKLTESPQVDRIQTSDNLGPFAKWLETYNKNEKVPAASTVSVNKNDAEIKETACEKEVLEKNFNVNDKGKHKNDNEIHHTNSESENRKNRQILKGRLISDVLIISDTEKKQQNLKDDSCNDVSKENTPILLDSDSKMKSKHPSRSERSRTAQSTPLNPDECSWDMMFDDNGDCLDPNLMEELTKAVGTVKIETPKSDYCLYEYKSELLVGNPYDELSHIVEIYNFPAEFKTEDLITIFNSYKSGGFEIKWVDDTHALGVFSSSLVAADVLAMNHPFVKIRPLSQGTAESKAKARRCSEFMQPYRTRPETCAALARRLVTGALGVRLKTAREEREAEKKVLKEARERRRLAAQQREDAWEGTFRSNS